MQDEQRARQALSLHRNSLLPELLAERAQDLTEQWQTETDPAKRELLWHAQREAQELKDFLYGRLSDLANTDE